MSDFRNLDDWPPAVAVFATDGSVAGYAPRLDLQHVGPHVVRWIEAKHERSFELGEEVSRSPNVFIFLDTLGRRYRLETLTLELYEKHVRPRTAGRPQFGSMDSLLAAMRSEW